MKETVFNGDHEEPCKYMYTWINDSCASQSNKDMSVKIIFVFTLSLLFTLFLHMYKEGKSSACRSSPQFKECNIQFDSIKYNNTTWTGDLSVHRHTTPEKFYIEACDDGVADVLAIDRVSTEMTLTGMKHNTHRNRNEVYTRSWVIVKRHLQSSTLQECLKQIFKLNLCCFIRLCVY